MTAPGHGIGVAVLRHAPTEWNALRRLQGRTDIALSAAGRAAAANWRLPDLPEASWENRRWLTSPLRRCRETAALMLRNMGCSMDPGVLTVDERLIERGFGAWEGATLAGLRARYGAEMAEWEAKGWDFRPPGGESPHDVLHRSMMLLQEMLQQDCSIICVTHRSVIRALYAAAQGWDMVGRPPEKLRDGCIHLFRLEDGAGGAALEVERLNLPLAPGMVDAGAAGSSAEA